MVAVNDSRLTSVMHIHIESTPSPPERAAFLTQLAEGITVTFGEPPTPATYELLVMGRPTEMQLRASPSLKMVVIPFAGIPPATRKLLRHFPEIALYNLHHNAPPTAEMAVALLLAVAKGIVPADQALRRLDWTPRYAPQPAVLLQGKTALILGYGNIGQRIGLVLQALGMQVMGTRRRKSDPAAGIYPADHLRDLLPQADLLMVALPATDENDGLLGAAELALLPQGAIVVNVGRATVIDQFALYDALKRGHLFGAGLDVWYHYPTTEPSRTNTAPADFPFHELENVVLSPHRAGGGGIPEIETLRLAALADFINRAARGEPLPNRVDLELGY